MPGSNRSRITAITDFLYLRMRHHDAWSSAEDATAPADEGLASLQSGKYCLLTTFRRSGAPVPTPVWFGLQSERLYFHSEAAVGKIKRIRNNPRVRVAPCTLRGKPLGLPIECQARIMAPNESQTAELAIARNYGMLRRLYEAVARRLDSDFVYVEVQAARDRQPS